MINVLAEHGIGVNKAVDNLIRNYVVSSDGNINVGDLCEFINGQVRKTYKTTATTSNTAISDVSSDFISTCLIDTTHILVAYKDCTNSNYCKAVILTISGATITVGTIYQVNSVTSDFISTCLIDTTHVLIAYRDFTNSGYCKAVILTISGTSITIGTIYQINSVNSDFISTCLIDSTHALAVYCTNSGYCKAVVLTISGTSITIGTIYQINSVNSDFISTCLIDSTHALAVYCTDLYYCYAVVLTISGTTITIGTIYQVNSVDSYYISTCLIDSTHVLIAYEDCTSGVHCMYDLLGIDNANISNTVVTHVKNPQVMSMQSGATGSTVKCLFKGITSGLSGLIPNNTYYCDDNGNLTTSITDIKIGVAISPTELLIKNGFWER
jgi:predicted anti-sigma-YlaC factor YlaD